MFRTTMRVSLLLAFGFCLSAIGAAEGADAHEPRTGDVIMREVISAPSDEILFNPGMGLYLAGWGGSRFELDEDAWAFTMADIIYFRPGWCDVEPDGPGSGFDAYFGELFDFWVKQRGKRLAFRVMSESMHSKAAFVTPEWVFTQEDIPGVPHVGLRGLEQIDPVFWDDRYLDAYCDFVQRLGDCLDGREGLEFIDIGGIGEWGEMHLGLHIPGRWTPEQLEETGFTPEKYIAAYRRIIDAHALAFPRTRVLLNVGSYAQINDYAALKGMHFRQDGLKPTGPSANVGKRFYHPYSRRGVICSYEFHSSYRAMQEKGWDLTETLEQGLSDPISYLNTNVFGGSQWGAAPDDVKSLFIDAGRRIGFRFVLKKLVLPEAFHLDGTTGGRIILEHHWANEGVAPCHTSCALDFTLHAADGTIVATQRHYPDTATTLWWPGESVVERTLLRVPAETPPGDHDLKVALVLPETPERHILLGISGRDADDRYRLCRIPGIRTARRTGTVFEQAFSDQEFEWRAVSGVSAVLDTSEKHSGSASLRVEGTQQGSWNYVSRDVPDRILPASRYRLSCWMRVEFVVPAKCAPYLKLGVTDAEGKWLDNFGTGRYDMSRVGVWQRLQATFDTPLPAAGGHLAVEKGGREIAVTVRFWLDDVQLELLEAP